MYNSPRLDFIDKRTIRNYFMNASLRYWQRAFSATNGDGFGEYVADRWFTGVGLDGVSGSQTVFSRSTDVPDSDAHYSIQALDSAGYALDDEISFMQRVESIFAKDFSGNSASIRLHYRTTGCDQVRVKLQVPTVEDDFSATSTIFDQTYAITGDDTWRTLDLEDVSILNSDNGLQVHFVFISNTAGTITTKVAKPQLNLGDKLKDFTLFGRDLPEELTYCQRYFEKSYDDDTPPNSGLEIAAGAKAFQPSASFYRGYFGFKVPKRTSSPITTVRSHIDGSINYVSRDTGVSVLVGNYVTGKNGFTFQAAAFGDGAEYRGHFTADAEL